MLKLRKIPPFLYLAYFLVLIGMLTLAIAGNRAVTVYYENSIVPGRRTIVVDPGHGGVDGGAVSCTGISESKINLAIALRFKDLINFMGIKTVMIRETDKSIFTSGTTIGEKKVSDLKNRVKIANSFPGSGLVSIHQNYFSDSQYFGAQVFYGKNQNSKILAELMQEELVSTLNQSSNRKCKRSTGVYLLENVKTTAILVECGFLSNALEERNLLDQEYQKKLSCIMASVCSRYLYDNPS